MRAPRSDVGALDPANRFVTLQTINLAPKISINGQVGAKLRLLEVKKIQKSGAKTMFSLGRGVGTKSLNTSVLSSSFKGGPQIHT